MIKFFIFSKNYKEFNKFNQQLFNCFNLMNSLDQYQKCLLVVDANEEYFMDFVL